MPTNTFPSARTQPAQHHWYNRLPSRPIRRRRYGSSVVNNVWNAFSNFGNAAQGNAAGLLATMRTQVDKLRQIIDASTLDTDQKPLLQQLVAETKQALDSLNPALLSQQVSRASFHPQPVRRAAREQSMRRYASEQSAISSNAKAALGCMAYLQDDNLFPGCYAVYQYVRERLEQIFRLMDGDFQVYDVESARQQQVTQSAPSSAPVVLNADGSMTPYTPPAAPAPSPVAGLEAKSPPWDGTPNMTADGEETVGSRQDWFSLYGTTREQFAARCSRWLQANGGGQAALAAHLRASGVPENVIGQVLPYV